MSAKFTFDLSSIPVPKGFSLTQTVCSYGFFTQQPNIWVPKNEGNPDFAIFRRQLLLSDDTAFQVRIAQTGSADRAALRVKADRPAVDAQLSQINLQVCRMLRLSSTEEAHVKNFQELHPKAKSEGFGRLFRSPTVWEDLLKSILLCNCGWTRTLAMNKALCAAIGNGALPSPAMLLQAGTDRLQSECGVGYRAKTLLRLAEQVVNEEADLEGLEDPDLSSEQVYQKLLPLPGVGPFTAANMLQLLGHYDRIPCDSETVRHLRKVHKLSACTSANVQRHAQQVYANYAPYQFLAYWHELWREYEALVGPFEHLAPASYTLLTGANMRRAAQKLDDTIAESDQAAQNENGSDQHSSPVPIQAQVNVQRQANEAQSEDGSNPHSPQPSEAQVNEEQQSSYDQQVRSDQQPISEEQRPVRKRAKHAKRAKQQPPLPSRSQRQSNNKSLLSTDELDTDHEDSNKHSSKLGVKKLRQRSESRNACAGKVQQAKAVGAANLGSVRRSQRVAMLQQLPV